MKATLNALAQTGLIIEFHNRGIRVSANGSLKPLALSTSPFPGFATDMQAQFMAMLCRAQGDSFLEETTNALNAGDPATAKSMLKKAQINVEKLEKLLNR